MINFLANLWNSKYKENHLILKSGVFSKELKFWIQINLPKKYPFVKQEIDELIANWQKDNKKVKNPPPMPDFNKAKYILPSPDEINFESGRYLGIFLEKKNE